MRRMFVAALGTVALAFAGCGDKGDGSLSAGESEEPTKAEYIAQADDICSDVAVKVKPFRAQLNALPVDAKPEDGAPIIERGLTQTRKGHERLRELAVPSEDKADRDAYVAAVDRALTAGDQVVQAARANDRAKVDKIVANNAGLVGEQKRLAKTYGFKVCGDAGG